MQKMRKHRLSENGISNYRAQMITGGARGDLMICWCEQHHGILHLSEKSTLKINERSHKVGNFLEINFLYFSKKNFQILLVGDWSKNKIAQKSFFTPEMKP
jgi:hypothetical protein